MALGPIMLDIEGLELQPADRELLREDAVGGLILFSRNYESPAQLTALIEEVRALRKPPLLIAVDHEGGRVQRFRDGFTAIPPMRLIGRHYDRDPDEALEISRTAGWLIGSELRAAGIDLSFSPCVDLDWGINTAIGDRALHRKPDAVSSLAAAHCRGLADAGMAAVAKHFPGHGAVVADSHEELPIDRREFGDLLDDMQPYEFLLRQKLVPAVMLSHVVYTEVDERPASLSPYWMQEQLRNQLRFDGAIFSDDMSMKATASYGKMADRARLSLRAGCDMVLVCNDRPAARKTVAALNDYSHPPSLVRLARLHGGSRTHRDELMESEDWQSAVARLQRWSDRPVLELGA